MAVLSALKPEPVFRHFETLCGVPHGSGNTKAASDLCVAFAKAHGLRFRQDAVNNVVIWKDASPGYEGSAAVILQAHIDMVCAKTEGCKKNMATEGLDLVTDGAFVWADQTSLGADDGIGAAIILAILEDDTLPHPPLEAVFTVDEETGMDGAFALDCSDLRGTRLLNLDSEEEGIFTVSCAGGLRSDSILPGVQAPLDGDAAGYTLTLGGLLGGHSGVEISTGRANANHLMGRVLFMAMDAVPGLRLAGLKGGQFDNVICRQCEAQIAVPSGQAAALAEFVRSFDAVLKNEYALPDPDIFLACAPLPLKTALDTETTRRVLHVLFTLPQGVQEMSRDFPGLPQTSLNLGILFTGADGVHFTYSVRSSIASQKELLRRKLRAIVESAGGSVSERSSYPGWQYRKESPLRETVRSAYRELTGREGVIAATHGGLECGLFVEKLPGIDVVSLGPELSDIHSPRERLDVASAGRTYELVCRVLARCRP